MKRSEIVEKEAVETDGHTERLRDDSLRKSLQNDGQNEVNHIKKGFSRVRYD